MSAAECELEFDVVDEFGTPFMTVHVRCRTCNVVVRSTEFDVRRDADPGRVFAIADADIAAWQAHVLHARRAP